LENEIIAHDLEVGCLIPHLERSNKRSIEEEHPDSSPPKKHDNRRNATKFREQFMAKWLVQPLSQRIKKAKDGLSLRERQEEAAEEMRKFLHQCVMTVTYTPKHSSWKPTRRASPYGKHYYKCPSCIYFWWRTAADEQ
jgi:hypothetical protein